MKVATDNLHLKKHESDQCIGQFYQLPNPQHMVDAKRVQNRCLKI